MYSRIRWRKIGAPRGPCPFSFHFTPKQSQWSFSLFAPSPPERSSPAPAGGEAAERTNIRFVSVETTVERIPKHGDNLGFDLFPSHWAGWRAVYTHACATSPTLTQRSSTLNDNQMTLGLGRSAQNISTAPTISYSKVVRIMPEEKKRIMIRNLVPILLPMRIMHRRGPEEPLTTDMSRNLSAKIKDFLLRPWHDL